jgi:hypothetical protein
MLTEEFLADVAESQARPVGNGDVEQQAVRVVGDAALAS